MKKKKAKQKFKKKAILKLFKSKTINEIIANLNTLKDQGYGNCKVEVHCQVSGGPLFWRSYTGKVKCNMLVPEEMV